MYTSDLNGATRNRRWQHPSDFDDRLARLGRLIIKRESGESVAPNRNSALGQALGDAQMDVLVAMDQLLVGAAERGEEPQHWMIGQNRWLKAVRQFRMGIVLDPDSVGPDSYKGVSVHFNNLKGSRAVGLMTNAGQRNAGQ